MRIAILGYGKMGKTIERIALERGHEVPLKIGSKNINDLNSENLKEIDVAIDFSIPEVAFTLNSITQKNKIPTVSGTTGWLDKLDEIKDLSLQNDSAFIYASNFSLGVNLFFELNNQLAQMMKKHKNYSVDTKEIHHIHKLDKPSGTAITLAEPIIANQTELTDWSLEKSDAGKLFIDVERTGEVPGTHIINYRSAIDTISISHEAHSREGFALGAVIAAEWLANKKGIYSMKDVLFS
jgi:4-hydroxy-tetrahydrodipicolinate reductase